jgi:small ligand-binding sensory domain FIST
VVARGWRSIGPELVVTESDPERALVQRLDGQPALERLRRLAADEVPGGEVPHINRALGIGPVPNGSGTAVTVRRVHGADRSNGAIAAGPISAGSVVCFWVRGDPASDLRRLLAGRQADTALAFVAEAGRRGYGEGDHDAEIIADALDITAVVGLVAPTQIGPVGDRLEAVDGEASVALLTDR